MRLQNVKLMQVKPRFDNYKFLEQFPIIKDDTGNELCLSLIEAKLPNTNSEFVISYYKYWTVVGKKQDKWGNGAISYSDIAYWKEKNKKLLKIEINGFLIEEIDAGLHHIFCAGIPKNENDFGQRTSFIIKPA